MTKSSAQDKLKKGRATTPAKDSIHKVWRNEPSQLDTIFRPKSVAIIGATETEGSVGRTLCENILNGKFKGEVYPVHPVREKVFGRQCIKNVLALPDGVELAVIVTPASTVPQIVADCVTKNIKSAIIISAGFKELGEKGEILEKKIMTAAAGKLRIIGPNCLGVMTPDLGFNATFAGTSALPGQVAFVSQSGALCTAVLDWSLREKVGFSAFVSIGSMLDVGWGDLIDHFGNDPNTKSILIYMESVGDSRAFMSAAREVSLSKPVIVLKVGRTDSARKAAMSHTGSIAGSDDVLDAAFRRSGVLRVTEIRELFDMAEILSKQPRPQGPNLAILTNAGGPGVLATDSLILSGGKLAKISEKSLSELNAILPEHWSHANPIDILGDGGPERYAKAAAILSKDPGIDGLLTILTPQAMCYPTETAQAIVNSVDMQGKPVMTSWMGADGVEKGRQILREASIPEFHYPDEAARLFSYMWQYTDNLKQLYETPSSSGPDPLFKKKADEACSNIFKEALKDGRVLLSEHESKQVLEAYGIPVTQTVLAASAEEAAKSAKHMGFPVVLKLHSHTITHKSDVGGIRLDLRSEEAVKEAFESIRQSVESKKGPGHFEGVTVQQMISGGGFELILGASPDAQFGPVILFGAGGVNVEIFKDVSLGLPPLNTTLARRLMERTRIFNAFHGSRGRKALDLGKLEEVLVRFSQLVISQKRIKEIDINPFYVSGDQLIALDARVVLYEPEISDDKIVRAAIRLYPSEYSGQMKTNKGLEIAFRPIRADDEPLMVRFHESLSDLSVHRRYFIQMNLDRRVAHERLLRVCFNDYDREIALVAEIVNNKERQIIGISRLSRTPHTEEAEFSTIIADAYQGQGLGGELMALMIEVAKKEKLKRVFAEIQSDNLAMIKLFREKKFTLIPDTEEGTVKAELFL